MKSIMTTARAMSSMEDQELLSLIANRQDKMALAEVYDRYRHSLGGFLRYKLFEDKLVDEVYNDVMLTVWQKAAAFRGDSKVSTWIFGIAYRMCMSHSRKEQKHTANVSSYELEEVAEVITEEIESSQAEQLRAAVTELSEDHRTVIEMAYFYGNSLAEIAEIVGCPLNTVKTRLFHARQNLKTIIEKQND